MAKAKKLPSGSWRCLVYDYTDTNGKRKYKSFTDSDPSPAGRRRCESMVAEYATTKEHRNKSNENMTVTEAIDRYIEKYPQLSETTVSGYRTTQQYGFQCLMNKKLSSLNNDILLDAINKECKRPSQSSKSKGKPLGAKTVRNEFGLISTISKKEFLAMQHEMQYKQKQSAKIGTLSSGPDGNRTRVQKPIPCPSTSVAYTLTFPPQISYKQDICFSSFMIRPPTQSLIGVVSYIVEA